MTVTYTHEVANARLGGFSNLLLRWRGSVFKLFYKEFAIYITLYTILSICYRHIAIPEFRDYFEKLCLQFQSYTDLVPISFVLGFYVSMVVGRWWQMYLYIPWPDRLMVIVTANVHGSDNRGRLIRRTLMRYLSLAQVLTYRSISTAVFKRFPTMQHVIDAGFMTLSEYKQYENVKTENVKYFLPCVWFSNLLSKVRQERRIYDDMTYQTILKELNDFRGCCGMLFSYDWISIPLVYTQVVTVAVYVFFMSTLLSRQYLDVTKNYPGHEVDLFVPIFTICQFFFYVGWLKVAEQLINPFGEDDDDFEVNFIIDRNLEISMFSVDNLYLSHPKLERDIYWNNPNPAIPYTAAAANHKLEAFLGSTIDMSLHRDEMHFLEQAQPDEGHRNPYLDVNQNYTGTEKKNLAHYQPPSHSSTKQPPTRAPNPVNFWRRFTGRDKDNEAKKSLLQKDFLSGRSNAGSQNNMVKEQNDDDDEKSILTPGHDDDSGDSDVGDGGGSEEDESDDNKTLRRSSISSLDGDGEDGGDGNGNSRKSSVIRKHSMAEPEDRPKAKKRKNSLLLTQTVTDPLTDKTKMKTSDKPKRPEAPSQRIMEGTAKNIPGRFTMGKSKKSPKKKTNAPRVNKRNDFHRKGEETEEERKNAQTRTFGLLKATKRKSAQALQRNARRANYPGNAWLRHKYPLSWRCDVTSVRDYASMTSGNEDTGRTEHDSPFGSMISFATSVPSPRPLRFSHFGKRGGRKQFDSVSISSCLTSPCANEDFSPSTGFLTASPRDHNPSSSMSMPFTEDLRRRLLVVNTTNTPSSSTATSPVLARAYPNQFGFPLYQPTTESGPDSDDVLVISTTARSASGTAWENTLEAIGEAATSADKGPNNREENRLTPPDGGEEKVQPALNNPFVSQSLSPGKNKERNLDVPPHRLLARSSSCPDVPICRLSDVSHQNLNTSKKKDISSTCSTTYSQNPLPSPAGNCQGSAGNLIADCSSPSKSEPLFHHEHEVVQHSAVFDESCEASEEKPCTTVPYTELTRYGSSELTPLLQQDDACDGDTANTQRLVDNDKTEMMTSGGETDSEIKSSTGSPTLGIRNPVYVVSDLGYCSAKEDGENAVVTESLSLLPTYPINKRALGSFNDRLSQISEEEMSTVSQPFSPPESIDGRENHASLEASIPDAVVIPIISTSDVVIDMT